MLKKEILINTTEKNIKAINAVLDEVQKRARTRTIVFNEIERAVHRIEGHLDLPRKIMEGVEVTVDINAQTFPQAYRGIPESTIFSAVYKRGNWWLTDVCRSRTKGPTQAVEIKLTEGARWKILEKACNPGIDLVA